MPGPSPRQSILEIAAYAGGEASAPGCDRPVRLASNENALGPSSNVLEAYRAVATELNRYPDGGCNELRAAIADFHGLDRRQIVCGAGSEELLNYLCRAYVMESDEVLYSEYGFVMYPIIALSVGAKPIPVPERNFLMDVDGFLERVTSRTRLVFIANPNNPSGTYITENELRRLHAELPGNVLLVVDAAYAEFVDEAHYGIGMDLVRVAKNVVVTRTFSKIYALSSLRLGWAYCPIAVTDVINRIRTPFNVSGPAQAAGIAALRDTEHFEKSRVHNKVWRDWTTNQLKALGLSIPASVANFLLVGFPNEPSRSARAAYEFARKRGVLVRPLDQYKLPNHLRITIGLREDMEMLVATLRDFFDQSPYACAPDPERGRLASSRSRRSPRG